MLFGIESCYNVHLHVTPGLPIAFLKKTSRLYICQEASGLENYWFILFFLAWFLYVYSDSFTVITKYFAIIRRNKHVMMMIMIIMTVCPVNLIITHAQKHNYERLCD